MNLSLQQKLVFLFKLIFFGSVFLGTIFIILTSKSPSLVIRFILIIGLIFPFWVFIQSRWNRLKNIFSLEQFLIELETKELGQVKKKLISFTQPFYDFVDELRRKAGARSIAEIIRDALHLYEVVLRHIRAGFRILMEREGMIIECVFDEASTLGKWNKD